MYISFRTEIKIEKSLRSEIIQKKKKTLFPYHKVLNFKEF